MIKVWGSNFSSLNLTLEAQYTLLGIFPVTLLSDLTHNSIPACVFEMQLIPWQTVFWKSRQFCGGGGWVSCSLCIPVVWIERIFFYSSKLKIFFNVSRFIHATAIGSNQFTCQILKGDPILYIRIPSLYSKRCLCLNCFSHPNQENAKKTFSKL